MEGYFLLTSPCLRLSQLRSHITLMFLWSCFARINPTLLSPSRPSFSQPSLSELVCNWLFQVPMSHIDPVIDAEVVAKETKQQLSLREPAKCWSAPEGLQPWPDRCCCCAWGVTSRHQEPPHVWDIKQHGPGVSHQRHKPVWESDQPAISRRLTAWISPLLSGCRPCLLSVVLLSEASKR